MSAIGQRVHEAIKARGLTLQGTEKAAGLARGALSKLVNPPAGGPYKGTRPAADTIQKIARTLGVRFDWLMRGEGPMDEGPAAASSSSPETRIARPSRYRHLEAAISYWPDRWSSAVLAAAREISLQSKHDPTPQEWTRKLDQLEAAIRIIARGEEPGREEDEAPSSSVT